MQYRETAALVVAGAVLPLVTIALVLSATATYGFHWAVPFFLLFASPLFAAGGLYLTGARAGSLRTPTWLPVGGRPTFGDQVPDRYHEEFAAETLDRPTETDADQTDAAGRVLSLALIYLVSIPVYTVVLWGLFG